MRDGCRQGIGIISRQSPSTVRYPEYNPIKIPMWVTLKLEILPHDNENKPTLPYP